MKKLKSIKSLKRKLKGIFSEYIRKRDNGICCTCNRKFDWKDGDAGHYINSTHSGTKYDQSNVHFQCRACNRFKKPMAEYAEFMYNKYGREIVKELLEQKHYSLVQFSEILVGGNIEFSNREAYNFLIKYYTQKLKELK